MPVPSPPGYLEVVRRNRSRACCPLLVGSWSELNHQVARRLRVHPPLIFWDEIGQRLTENKDLAQLAPPHFVYVGIVGEVFKAPQPYKCWLCGHAKPRHTCLLNPSADHPLSPLIAGLSALSLRVESSVASSSSSSVTLHRSLHLR
jgi:hypothetical protein